MNAVIRGGLFTSDSILHRLLSSSRRAMAEMETAEEALEGLEDHAGLPENDGVSAPVKKDEEILPVEESAVDGVETRDEAAPSEDVENSEEVRSDEVQMEPPRDEDVAMSEGTQETETKTDVDMGDVGNLSDLSELSDG